MLFQQAEETPTSYSPSSRQVFISYYIIPDILYSEPFSNYNTLQSYFLSMASMLPVSACHPSQLQFSLHVISHSHSLPYLLPFSLSSSVNFFNTTLSFRQPLRIRSLDAAQLCGYESKRATEFHNAQKLKIAIIGFSNFGQFLAKTLVRQGHTVLAHSRSDYSDTARKLGVSFFTNPDDLCEDHPEVILLCTSIISTRECYYHCRFKD